MVNRQLYTLKFNSSRLKRFKYDIDISFEQAKKNDELAPLAEGQMLRTIRKVLIDHGEAHRYLDRIELEELYLNLKIATRKNKKDEVDAIFGLIKNMIYFPEYISIVMEHETHYDYLFENGVTINGQLYRRISTSAGQARVSTVVFCSTKILDTVNQLLDNGRDKTVKFSPSKFSAYKGLYSSATKVVTTPRFCVVEDYESETEFNCNWVTETGYDDDDIIEKKKIKRNFNRWDGMGIISPEFAVVWQNDLNLDYLPSTFGIRQSYIKGMVAVMDYVLFCKEKNNGNYMVKSLFKDSKGGDIFIDLREVDVILTESQFKLWMCYESLDEYKQNCIDNKLSWGVGLYSDKNLKNTLKLNYQFLQANNIKKEDIPELCEDFVSWITNVSYNDAYSALLFLLGVDMTSNDISRYMSAPGNWWIKSLIVDHSLINSKYVKQKIYKLVKVRMENGYVGSFFVKGNNQTLISDPYGLCQYICGQEVTGLIAKDRYYINYWNENKIDQIVGMRPPLTSRAEVLEMRLSNTIEQQKWFKYLYSGIVVNIHGAETDYWAGSDWDLDFLSTTSNAVLVKSTYKNEYPVCYDAPRPEKVVFNERDLFNSDKFAFGSIIGSITNKSTSGHALLPHIEKKFGKNSDHYTILENRVRMTCKLQSAQIDKAKLGRDVKEIPKVWVDRKYIVEKYGKDTFETGMYNEILLDRHPYFFIHMYPQTKAKYKKHVQEYDGSSYNKFGVGVFELINIKNKTNEQLQYIELFFKYMPVIYSDCVMNNVCRHLEVVAKDIKQYFKTDNCDERVEIMISGVSYSDEIYNNITEKYLSFVKTMKESKSLNTSVRELTIGKSKAIDVKPIYNKFREEVKSICTDDAIAKDCLVSIFYQDYKSSNKDLLWETYGEEIFSEILSKQQDEILFPILSSEGSFIYEGNNFILEEVDICNTMKSSMVSE